MKNTRKSGHSGFSLTEVMIAIGLLSVVCGLAVHFGGRFQNVANHTKLKQDVQVINSAAKMFLANGGSFDGIKDPQQILDRMKSAQATAQRASFVGMTGATIDKRTVAVPVTGKKAKLAAVWDPKTNQFVLEETVSTGISNFALDEALADVEYADLARDPSILAYSEKPGWIWDYEERPPTFAGGPSIIPVGDKPDTRPPASPVALLAPRIVLSDTSFNSSTPEITIFINNPNPTGTSQIFYSLIPTGGSHPPPSTWGLYSGSIVTQSSAFPDGFEVASFAKSIDPGFLDSDSVDAATTSEFFNTPTKGNVLFIVDASSSMEDSFGSQTRFEATIEELVSAIQGLPGNIKFNVAMFDGAVHWTDGSNKLHPANQLNKQDLIDQVEKVKTGSGTNYSAGLSLPPTYQPVPDQVIFLSDGEPNNNSFLTELAELVQLGVRVDTIGLSSSSSAVAVLQLIASETGGNMVLVE